MRLRFAAMAAVVAISLSPVVTGCGGGGGGGGGFAGATGSAVIGANGGTVTGGTGATNASATIPAGALSAPVTITLVAASNIGNAGFTPVGTAIQLGPSGQTFASPVTIKVPFDPALFPVGKTANDIVVVKKNESTGQLTLLTPTFVDTFNRTVTVTATSFSILQSEVSQDLTPTITSVTGPNGTTNLISTAGGQTVTINGSNLNPGATVTFGSIAASASQVTANGTSLTVVTPAQGAGVVSVTVKNLDGKTATFANAFQYATNPVFTTAVGSQTINAFTTGNVSVATIEPAGAALTFALSPAVANMSIGSNGAFSFSPTIFQVGTYNVTVTATSVNGTASQTFTVTVPRPSQPSVLLTSGALLPGAPSGSRISGVPTITSMSRLGAFAATTGFVASGQGILHRSDSANAATQTGGGSTFQIAPTAGIAIVATQSGPSPIPGVGYSSLVGFSVSNMGADGTSAFICQITSDTDATTQVALFALGNTGSASLICRFNNNNGPGLNAVASVSTTNAVTPTGTFRTAASLPVADGVGGVYFLADVTSSTNSAVTVRGLYRWSSGTGTRVVSIVGQALPASPNTPAGARNVTGLLSLMGAANGEVLVNTTSSNGIGGAAINGSQVYKFNATGGATLIAEANMAVNGAAVTNPNVANFAVAARILDLNLALSMAAAANDGQYMFRNGAPVTSGSLMINSDTVGGNALTSINNYQVDDNGFGYVIGNFNVVGNVLTRNAPRTGAAGLTVLVKQGDNAPITTAVTITYSSLSQLGARGNAVAWGATLSQAPLAGIGAGAAGQFSSVAGGTPFVTLLAGMPIPSTPFFIGSGIAGNATFVHPESNQVVTSCGVVNGIGLSIPVAIVIR